MKKASFIFIWIITFHPAVAQSKMIREVFRLLPPDHLYGLSPGTRDSMLKGKTYYPAGNDSNSVEAYNFGISASVKDYIYVSMSYETGQRASGLVEIRSFKTKKGENIIVVSETGGVWRVNYQQNSLIAFIYRNKKLTPYKKDLFPAIDESVFMKPGIPDSVKKMILNNSNRAFDLSNEAPALELNSDYLVHTAVSRKWLEGDRIEFTWTGDHFVISRIRFDD